MDLRGNSRGSAPEVEAFHLYINDRLSNSEGVVRNVLYDPQSDKKKGELIEDLRHIVEGITGVWIQGGSGPRAR